LKNRFPVPRISILFANLFLLALLGAPVLAGPGPRAARPPASAFQAGEQRVVARVYFTSLDDLNRLAASLDVWEVHHAEGYLVALLTPAQSTALEQAGCEFAPLFRRAPLYKAPNNYGDALPM